MVVLAVAVVARGVGTVAAAAVTTAIAARVATPSSGSVTGRALTARTILTDLRSEADLRIRVGRLAGVEVGRHVAVAVAAVVLVAPCVAAVAVEVVEAVEAVDVAGMEVGVAQDNTMPGSQCRPRTTGSLSRQRLRHQRTRPQQPLWRERSLASSWGRVTVARTHMWMVRHRHALRRSVRSTTPAFRLPFRRW